MNRVARQLWLAALVALRAAALDLASLKPEGHLSDFAGVVDGAHRREIEDYCRRLAATSGVEIALVTLVTLDGEPIEDVANKLYRQFGVGQKGKNEGALFLLVTRDRRSRLEVGYGLEPLVPDGFAGDMLRHMRGALREHRYGEALLTGAHELGDRVLKEKGLTLENTPRRRRQRKTEGFPMGALVTGAIVLLMLSKLGGGRGGRDGGNFLAGMILGNLMSGALHGRHRGGGFGGYDSSDSFGGFGGGDSGGGGASGDW
ncbi:MAG: TPM domain-containing protein [Acidobacteria bacterium]|nr:TPM domain-containing protein [Acidobacteriota bacterium]